jgi:hypothetical protein
MHAYTQTRCVHKPETDAQVQDTDQSRHNHTLSHLQKHTCGFHNCTHLSVWANHVEEQRMKDSIFCRVAIHNYERACNTTRLAATWGRACVRVCQDWGPYKEKMDKTFQSVCACAFRVHMRVRIFVCAVRVYVFFCAFSCARLRFCVCMHAHTRTQLTLTRWVSTNAGEGCTHTQTRIFAIHSSNSITNYKQYHLTWHSYARCPPFPS